MRERLAPHRWVVAALFDTVVHGASHATSLEAHSGNLCRDAVSATPWPRGPVAPWLARLGLAGGLVSRPWGCGVRVRLLSHGPTKSSVSLLYVPGAVLHADLPWHAVLPCAAL